MPRNVCTSHASSDQIVLRVWRRASAPGLLLEHLDRVTILRVDKLKMKYCLRRNFGANGPNIYANVFFCVHFYFCVFLGVGISAIVVQQTLVSDEGR